jgi:glyoxylase-like metal-dependent hydrolase (beta-lactamase superfamily II)
MQVLSMQRIFFTLSSLLLFLPLLPAYGQAYSVGSYVSPAKTFSTANYWIAGPQSTVMIDTQFLPKEGLLALREAQRVGANKVSHALVLHPNPDKFNGTAALQAQGIAVYTSAQVASAIPGVHTIRLGWFAEDFKPDYPQDAAKPTSFGDRTQEVDWGGIKIKLHVLGAGASAAHVVAQAGDAVFVGDLVNIENHAWLELGTIDEWLRRLEEIKAMGAQRVFPGRGKPGGAELLDQQAQYLRFVQKLVQAEQPSGELGWLTKLKLQRAIELQYPKLGYALFMRDGLPAVWRNEAAKRLPAR